MRVSIIVAVSRNRVIGRGGQLPWRLSADLRRFKQLTMGHPLIMGRKTFESIGRVLPGRTSIVLTRHGDVRAPDVLTAPSFTDALRMVAGTDEVFVIGGGEIYSLALPLCDRMYVTTVQTESEGDTFFPPWKEEAWQLVEQSSHPADDKNAFPLLFQVFDRVGEKE